MSGAQHTPGPWEVDEMLGEVTSCHGTVAVIMAQDDYEKPDLNLVAAAPDMLAALMALDAYWSEDFAPPSPEPDQDEPGLLAPETIRIWRAARAAVAKATGK